MSEVALVTPATPRAPRWPLPASCALVAQREKRNVVSARRLRVSDTDFVFSVHGASISRLSSTYQRMRRRAESESTTGPCASCRPLPTDNQRRPLQSDLRLEQSSFFESVANSLAPSTNAEADLRSNFASMASRTDSKLLAGHWVRFPLEIELVLEPLLVFAWRQWLRRGSSISKAGTRCTPCAIVAGARTYFSSLGTRPCGTLSSRSTSTCPGCCRIGNGTGVVPVLWTPERWGVPVAKT